MIGPLWLSTWVALLATALATVVGVPCAWVLARRRFPLRDALSVVVLLPLVLPPTVLGYYLLLLVGRRGPVGQLSEWLGLGPIVFTPAAAVLAACVAALPFVVRAAQAGFEQLDPMYEEAARTLGRSERSIFFTITLPLAWRTVLAGVGLGFARAIGEFGATLMIAGNIPGRTQTASLAIYDAVQTFRYDAALQWSIALSLVAAVVLWLMTRSGTRRHW